MCNVCVLLNLIYLIFMNEAFDIGALFNEAGSHEVDLACLKTYDDIEDYNYEKIRFVRPLSCSSLQVSHEFIHVSLDKNELEHRARFISDFGKLSDLPFEIGLCSSIITRLEAG